MKKIKKFFHGISGFFKVIFSNEFRDAMSTEPDVVDKKNCVQA